MSLSVGDFDAFHEAVHDRPPFSWQSRLLRQIVESKEWPHALDLPTGAGKTTCIDIAVFALALDAANAPAARWCPRRIAMVVDRRIVVDQVAGRGRKLVRALGGARIDQPILRDVSAALALLCGGEDGEAEPPLGVYTLRGGVPKDDGWARTPDQPLIIASTVDQLGSRLLIQGYGVSSRMRPIQAGLLANDTLILLDEAHLSQPFKQTLEAIGRLRTRFVDNRLPRRFQFAFLSATPGDADPSRFTLTPDEMAPSSALGLRLGAEKPTRIQRVSGRNELATRVTDETKALLDKHNVVAAVVNRVATALAVFGMLRKGLGESADVVLLTGRMRPLDRDDVLDKYQSRVAAELRQRRADERKLVVVGTQCIEAGADFDFDAMVTESASFDGLRQRFGRVDRLGEYRNAEGVIVHDKQEKDDPIYGATIVRTVEWLEEQRGKKGKTVDFGSRSLLDAPADLLAPKEDAPTLLPAYLDLWSQTSPEPSVVPEPGLFLHGPQSGPEDVQIVWRIDLNEDQLALENVERLVGIVGAVPPSSLEAVSLPFTAARKWLEQQPDALGAATDLELKEHASEDDNLAPRGRAALRWRGDNSEIVHPASLRPGDTLIVPSRYGGIDPVSRCFDPQATTEVADLAERAVFMARGQPVLRLHPDVLRLNDLHGLSSFDPEPLPATHSALAALAETASGWRKLWLERLAGAKASVEVQAVDDDGDGWCVLRAGRAKPNELLRALAQEDEATVEEGLEPTTDEESAHIGVAVSLDFHSKQVETYARAYAKRLGLDANGVADDIALAAWLHDIGKADRRFQLMLHGGSEIAYYRDEGTLLAKSAMSRGSTAERRLALRRSGYPAGTRHEVQSLAMLDVHADVAARAHDLDLVKHLVASHHGFCRPFAPAVEDTAPVSVSIDAHHSDQFGTMTFATASANELHRLDSALADRFWGLVEKYGWFELCWLEAILRLADHRASEKESGGGP